MQLKFDWLIVLENLRRGIMVTDVTHAGPAGPRIIYVNSAWLKMTGYDREELRGKTPRILQGQHTDPAVVGLLKQKLLNREVFHGQTWNYRKNGEPFLRNWYCYAIYGELGTPIYYVAEKRQNDYLGTEHLLLAVLKEEDGLPLANLKRMGITPDEVRMEIERNLPQGTNLRTFGDIPFPPRAKKVLELAVEEARLLGHNYIGSEHIFLGLVREEEGIGGKILRSFGANLLGARQLTINFSIRAHTQSKEKRRTTPALDEFGRDLTLLAKEGMLDPVICREDEIERLIQILGRRINEL